MCHIYFFGENLFRSIDKVASDGDIFVEIYPITPFLSPWG